MNDLPVGSDDENSASLNAVALEPAGIPTDQLVDSAPSPNGAAFAVKDLAPLIVDSGALADVTSDKPARLTAESRFSMRGCKITRPHLGRIWQLATEGFSSDANISITTSRKAGVIESQIEGESIDGMLDGVRRATIAGDPNYIDNIDLYIRARLGRTVFIRIAAKSLTGKGVNVTVKGEDPEWVRGRIGGLKDLFADAQSRPVLPWGTTRLTLLNLGFFAASGINLLLAPVTKRATLSVSLLLFFAIYVTLGGSAYVLGTKFDRRARTELILFPEPEKRRRDWVNIGILVAALVGIVVAIAAIIVAHSDAVHPH